MRIRTLLFTFFLAGSCMSCQAMRHPLSFKEKITTLLFKSIALLDKTEEFIHKNILKEKEEELSLDEEIGELCIYANLFLAQKKEAGLLKCLQKRQHSQYALDNLLGIEEESRYHYPLLHSIFMGLHEEESIETIHAYLHAIFQQKNLDVNKDAVGRGENERMYRTSLDILVFSKFKFDTSIEIIVKALRRSIPLLEVCRRYPLKFKTQQGMTLIDENFTKTYYSILDPLKRNYGQLTKTVENKNIVDTVIEHLVFLGVDTRVGYTEDMLKSCTVEYLKTGNRYQNASPEFDRVLEKALVKKFERSLPAQLPKERLQKLCNIYMHHK